MRIYRVLYLIFVIFLMSNLLFNFNVKACKDIVACGDSTEGDYNLLLKVRDPSRSGLQVLCIVPVGYVYSYHHPWTAKTMDFVTNHKYIGVASKGDAIPNIVKAGMSLSTAGISYGDADTDSNWKNPTKFAWDDFDWIRYACEKADTEDEAVDLMTQDLVKKMHATGVSENLFIVGPKKGVVIEADAFRYKINEIENGIAVMSNYPKDLWKSQVKQKLPIARSFDTVVEKYVRNKATIRLKSIYGIKIIEIGNDYILAKPVSIFHAQKTGSIGVVTKIMEGERQTVGYYSVELLYINGNKAKVRISYKFKAWEEKMLEYIEPEYGKINIKKMINWSRLDTDDLDGLRPMCEEFYEYEAVAIYKIPKNNYDILSIGWFSPNHACSSIYVPFHICDNDIYTPYKTGDAAQLSLDLFYLFEHNDLLDSFTNVENVFLNEIDFSEELSKELISKKLEVSNFLTIVDLSMQRQAYLFQEIWKEISQISNQEKQQEISIIIEDLWDTNYENSLNNMKDALMIFSNDPELSEIKEKVVEIILDISRSRIDEAKLIGKDTTIFENKYEYGKELIYNEKYEKGFDILQNTFSNVNMLIQGKNIENTKGPNDEKEKKISYFLLFMILIIIIVIVFLIQFIFKRKVKSNQKH